MGREESRMVRLIVWGVYFRCPVWFRDAKTWVVHAFMNELNMQQKVCTIVRAGAYL
jgi:hypothetical protein